MKTLLEFSIVFVGMILPQILSSLFRVQIRRMQEGIPNLLRLSLQGLNYAGSILVLLYIAIGQPGGLASIGLTLVPSQLPRTLYMAAGATCYLLLVFVIIRFRSKDVQQDVQIRQRQVLAAMGYSQYRALPERVAAMINLWLGVVVEELVFRGYLILLLGARTGSYIPWLVFSIFLTVTVHLYQGFTWKVAYAHVFFAGVFIVAALVTGNLVAALIPHLVYDTVWILQGWSHAKELKALAPPSI
jgi:membrane protease YdiL (CAAX protease family)